MERIIKKPHLPEGEVRCLIIGEKYRIILENALNRHNISIISAENNPFIDERISGHVDLSVVHMGDNRILTAEYLKDSEFIHKIHELGFKAEFVSDTQKIDYPYDAMLNACILGDKVICNPKTVNDKVIVGRDVIKCNQGYTKCSVAAVDEHSIITSDKMIAKNSALYGIESLLIDDSFVELTGFKKGFIGGASFKISKNKIAFTGTIECTEAKNKIESFLNERCIEAVYLTDSRIFDIGSAIPIIEEI